MTATSVDEIDSHESKISLYMRVALTVKRIYTTRLITNNYRLVSQQEFNYLSERLVLYHNEDFND